ncbi:TetR/AcrR family transcriptional regulator [Vibrio gangliei]|uniref:TetR/AcrR family transcriptional regulator n=1 Tax=Vibrio gangliei TaxID=2077090 RepID=UPI000D01B720|nr:CerR family C-terminal domain-containing protein [Vibrio gangliei]
MNKSKTSSRSDGASTKQRILETAIRLFAQNGLAGTPNKQIAQEAGADLASINYHFGNRSGLYQASLISAHSHLFKLEILQAIDAQPVDSTEKLKLLLDNLCHSANQNQQGYGQLIARELMSPSEHLTVLFNTEVQPKITIVKKIISDISGIPANEPELYPCLLSVAAPCLMMLMSNPNLPTPFVQIGLLERDYLSRHMYSFCLAGLKAAGENYTASQNQR